MDRFYLNRPVLASGFCHDWPSSSWNTDKLAEILGNKTKIACRLSKKNCEKTMETDCVHREITMDSFNDWLKGDMEQGNPLTDFPRTEYCCYIDYKYMKDLFQDTPDIFSHVKWSSVGLPQFDGSDSTIWIGSEGANTPCHQDTYGFNLVTQIQGRKLWLLFPPEDAQFLYPTRIPYEESSIFSDVNVRNPDLLAFPLMKKSHPVIITLCPGQTLYVPRHWWHYVESLEPSISINVWVPVEEDRESRYHEAITRSLASSLIRDFTTNEEDDNNFNPVESWLNPTETLTNCGINMALLKTSLTHLLEVEKSSVTNEVCKHEEVGTVAPSSHTEMKVKPGGTSSLSELASALGHYSSDQVSSPFELNYLKRRASERLPGDEYNKKPKLNSDPGNSQKQIVSGRKYFTNDDERGFAAKKSFCVNSCSIDVYLKFMRDLCEKTSCVCKRGLQTDELSGNNSDVTTVSRENMVESEHNHMSCVNPNPPNLKRRIQETHSVNSTSLTKIEEQSRLTEQGEPSVSHPSEGFSPRDTPSACGFVGKDSFGKAFAHASESKEMEKHNYVQVGDMPRPDLLNPDVTDKEFTEAFISSVLHPDVIWAVSVKLKENLLRKHKNYQ